MFIATGREASVAAALLGQELKSLTAEGAEK